MTMITRQSKQLAVAALVAASTAACAPQTGAPTAAPALPVASPAVPVLKPPARILFIGNSQTYTNDLPAMVAALAGANGHTPPEVRSIAAADLGLPDHWERGDALRAIAEGGWDVVVLQQGPSSLPENRQILVDYARRFADEIRKAGAAPALYMVWPSRERAADFVRTGNSYALAAREAEGILLPVGDAWRDAWQREPCLALYSPDELHASRLGSWLAAMVIYERLFGRAPDALPAETSADGASAPAIRDAAQAAAARAQARVDGAASAADEDYRPPTCAR